MLGVVEVDEANIILTAILAFSAIKLLFCSLLAAVSATVVAVAEAAANKGELRNSNAAVEGSNKPGWCGGPPGPPGKPIRPICGGIIPGCWPGIPEYGPKSES